MKAYIYGAGLTGHIAWEFEDGYFSFHPGNRISDFGTMELPLPGGPRKCAVHAHAMSLRDKDEDMKTYKSSTNPPQVLDVPHVDAANAAAFAWDLADHDLPYILWDSVHDIGAINCVTTSVMIFNVALPTHWPPAWDSKWGDVFGDLRNISASGRDWINHVIRNPVPRLMHVAQFEEMVRNWRECFP